MNLFSLIRLLLKTATREMKKVRSTMAYKIANLGLPGAIVLINFDDDFLKFIYKTGMERNSDHKPILPEIIQIQTAEIRQTIIDQRLDSFVMYGYGGTQVVCFYAEAELLKRFKLDSTSELKQYFS